MFVHTYDLELLKDGEPVKVSLRISTGAQIKLKKRWNESTQATLFNAVDDIERFVDLMNSALTWKGNTNQIQSGEELTDLLADNDMLGMLGKQRLLTSIGRASNLLSEDEKQAFDKKSEAIYKKMLSDDAAVEDDQGNA